MSAFERKLQLLRGSWLQRRGVHAGRRFGVGKSTQIHYPRCLNVENDVTIGDFSYLHCLSARGVWIGQHSSIDRNLWLHCGGTLEQNAHGFFEFGRFSFIGCNGVIGAGGGVRIGNNVLIGQNVNIHAENHIFDEPTRLIREQGVSYQGITIEDDVWVGSKVTILDGVTVGQGAVVGAGAVVTKSVAPFAVVAGVPARVVGMRGKQP